MHERCRQYVDKKRIMRETTINPPIYKCPFLLLKYIKEKLVDCLIILLVLIANPVVSQDLQPDWFTIIKGPESESKPLIKPDNKGNIFVTGVLSLYDPIFQTEDGFIDSVKIERYNSLNSTTYFTKLDRNGKVLFNTILVQEGYADP